MLTQKHSTHCTLSLTTEEKVLSKRKEDMRILILIEAAQKSNDTGDEGEEKNER